MVHFLAFPDVRLTDWLWTLEVTCYCWVPDVCWWRLAHIEWKTAHFWYFAPISILAWDNILILTPRILDLIMKKAAGRRGWWWKPFAWLYGRRHAKFLWAIIFCSNVFANDFFQTALRFLSLEIWLVKMRNTELFTKERWGLQLFTKESTRL